MSNFDDPQLGGEKNRETLVKDFNRASRRLAARVRIILDQSALGQKQPIMGNESTDAERQTSKLASALVDVHAQVVMERGLSSPEVIDAMATVNLILDELNYGPPGARLKNDPEIQQAREEVIGSLNALEAAK